MVKNRNDEGVVFLLIGRMMFDKGINEFIEATRLLKKNKYRFECQLLGPLDYENVSGIKCETIKKWEEESIIKYLGSTTDVRKYIKNSDCIVLPSYREGTPRTLLEGAAMAKPIITTDVPGCRWIVEDGKTGFLCKERDYTDLFKKMESFILLSDYEKKMMGIQSRKKIIKEFDENIVIEKYVNEIEKIKYD